MFFATFAMSVSVRGAELIQIFLMVPLKMFERTPELTDEQKSVFVSRSQDWKGRVSVTTAPKLGHPLTTKPVEKS